ncbi:hypothetical protein C8J25_101856 [Sphingomonas faeni]|uniref:Uncharacterized protein n=1 Tax=Sphingomonas faeni TaxID=185950 RepID=A0A2T5UCW9_9SPHN|nr:hypothetical protein [Sphingomonas faeni]PTW49348.1 hypothetical protein C8J25_101856 [Sphingomonas faeni]
MLIALAMLATMGEVAAKPVRSTYAVAKPVAEVQRCLLLASPLDVRVVDDSPKVMLGFAALSNFKMVITLIPSEGGTTAELRGATNAEELGCLQA